VLADCSFGSLDDQSSSGRLVAGSATMDKPTLGAVDFRFEPFVSSEAVSTRIVACTVSALSRTRMTSAKAVVKRAKQGGEGSVFRIGCDEISRGRRSTVVLRGQPERNQP
jgi:hypothetical protein